MRNPRYVLQNWLNEVVNDFNLGDLFVQAARANRTHGPTVTGTVSDHQGPSKFRWAIDIPAYSLLEGDRMASDIAEACRLNWRGSGIHTETRYWAGARYQLQLIWRAPGHFDHIHIGIHRLDVPVPPPQWP